MPGQILRMETGLNPAVTTLLLPLTRTTPPSKRNRYFKMGQKRKCGIRKTGSRRRKMPTEAQ